MDKAFSVGLTGGIGCGKTTVADMFAALGASVIDTDQIAHSLTAPHGAAMPALLAEFGEDFATPEGALDRAKMRALVFSDATARARLEAILHPRIRDATAAADDVVNNDEGLDELRPQVERLHAHYLSYSKRM